MSLFQEQGNNDGDTHELSMTELSTLCGGNFNMRQSHGTDKSLSSALLASLSPNPVMDQYQSEYLVPGVYIKEIPSQGQ